MYLIEKEDDASSDGADMKIHKILNHKSKEQIYYTYKNAGKLNEEVKKIDTVHCVFESDIGWPAYISSFI